MEFSPHLRQLFQLRGKAATYTPPAGGAVTCRAIRQGGGQPIMVGPVRVTVERTCFHIRRADVADPVAGATLEIGDETFTVDAVQPVERDADGLMWALEVSWGAEITYRSITGSGPTQSPPQGSGFTVAAPAALGAGTISIKAPFTVGKLLTGDTLTIAGDSTEYTVTSGVQAVSNEFTAVPVTPVLAAAAAADAAVTFSFARDFALRAAVAGYQANEIAGGVQSGDRRLVILQSAITAAGMDNPKAGDRVTIDGRGFTVQSATAIYRGADAYAWDVQVRA